MMRRFAGLLAFIAIFTILNVDLAQAGWRDFWGHLGMSYARNKAWPQPWLHKDQAMVRATFDPMVERGWQMQNTLTPDHFDLENGQLNAAGVSKVKNILRNSPRTHQTIFVFADRDDSTGPQRVRAIETQLRQWMPENEAPAVVQSYAKPRGVTGSYADAISRKFEQALPTPQLTGSSNTPGSIGGN